MRQAYCWNWSSMDSTHCSTSGMLKWTCWDTALLASANSDTVTPLTLIVDEA